MLLRVLGPLEVHGDDGLVSVGGAVPRRVLCALAARSGAVVSMDALVAAAWGDEPPSSAERTVQSYITRIRESLVAANGSAPLVLERSGGGFRLDIESTALDASRFEAAVIAAPDVTAAEAARSLREALALWRTSTPYADLQDTAYPSAQAARLLELRGTATEALVQAELDAGNVAVASAEAEALLREDPYRERLRELLMVALYRQGRQADALAAYRRAVDDLDEGLGIKPGPRLRELEAQILAQDPALLGPPPQSRRPCPYKGLARYDLEDSDLYVGRERLVEEIVGRMVDSGLLVVVGPSGAGKSSLVRAGLLPALRQGGLPGSASWTTRVITPGRDPLAALEMAGVPDVLVVDQAEEALLADDGVHLAVFGDRVLALVESGTRVVLALRADFYGRLTEHPALARRAGPATVLVAPPDDDELRRIVVEPAVRVGLQVEAALVELVVAEVRGRPGALPVLSTALVRTWEHRDGDRLTVASYRTGGGVEAALQRVGEEAWAALASDNERAACRRILLRLAVDEDGSWVRRRARRSEVAPDEDAAAFSALTVLTARRLVIARAEDLDIAHESLLTGWPRLYGWLEDGRAHREVRDRLAAAATAWVGSDHDPTELYAGTRLQAALDAAAASPQDLTPGEREFLAASAAQVERAVNEQRERADREARGRRRTRVVAAALAVALVVAASAGGFAIVRQRDAQVATTAAQRAALAADAERLGALARAGGDYDRALLYAVQAVRLDPSTSTESDLFATLERGAAVTTVSRLPGLLGGLAYTADGRSIVVVALDGTVARYPAHGGPATTLTGPGTFGFPRSIAMLPDGHAVVGGVRGPTLIDLSTGKALGSGGGSPVNWALSRDSTRGAVQVLDSSGVGAAEVGVAAVTPGAKPRYARTGSPVTWIESCGDAACVMTQDRRLLRIRFSDAHILTDRQLPAATVPARFAAAPDGSRVAVAEADGSLSILDPATGRVVETLPGGRMDVAPLRFSPDGTRLVSRDFATVLLWQLGSGTLPDRFEGHSGRVVSAAFSPDGTTLTTGADDRTMISWDLSGQHRLGSILTRGLTARTTTLWATDTTVVSGEEGGLLQFVDRTTGAVQGPVGANPHRGAPGILTARTGRTGNLLVVADQANLTAVWDLTTRRSLGTIDVPPAQGSNNDDTWVSPDGALAATMRTDDGPVVIDVATRTVVRQLPPLPFPAARLRSTSVQGWSPDGRELIITRTLEGSAELIILNSVTGIVRLRVPIPGKEPQEAVEDPHGRFYAVAMVDGTVRFLDTHDGHPLAPPTTAVGEVYNVSVSPDGHYVSATGSLPAVRIWDTTTYREVGTPLPLDIGASDARARFAPDGRLIVTSGATVRTVAVGVDAWIARACQEVGRTLTPDEWRDILPDRRYDPACSR